MNEAEEQTPNILSDDTIVDEMLAVIGVEEENKDSVRQADGSLIIPIGDRAVSVEHQTEINSVAIIVFIVDTSGLTLPTIMQDLLTLNAHPKETGALFFGMVDREIVGTLLMPEIYADARNLAQAVIAVADSASTWEQVIETAVDQTVAEALEESERASFDLDKSGGYV